MNEGWFQERGRVCTLPWPAVVVAPLLALVSRLPVCRQLVGPMRQARELVRPAATQQPTPFRMGPVGMYVPIPSSAMRGANALGERRRAGWRTKAFMDAGSSATRPHAPASRGQMGWRPASFAARHRRRGVKVIIRPS